MIFHKIFFGGFVELLCKNSRTTQKIRGLA